MAIVNDSDDKWMADDEFDDFTVSDDDLSIFEEENSDKNQIANLISQLKQKLKIHGSLKHTEYPYKNPDYFFDTQNFTESSDDEQGAVAMKVCSDADNEVEIDPYWMDIKVDELQGLGNPIKKLSDTDSMPDLVSVSDSED